MNRFFTIIAAGIATLLLGNCTLSTPQARIDRNQGLFESLPAKEQELVSQGRITKGMSKSAVYLALGDPSRKVEGYRNDTRFERWDYTRLQPHYYNSFHSYFGRGWGHGRRGGSYHGFGFSPSIEYVPYRSSTVVFKKGSVDSYERLTPSAY